MTAAVRRTLCALALVSVSPGLPPATAQVKKLTLERLHSEPPLQGSLPTGLAWHPDGRLTFLRRKATDGPADLVALDPGSGKETLLLSADRVKHPTTGKPLSLSAYSWARDGDRLLVAAEADLFVVEPKTGVARAQE
jgi:hypothetical protein